MKVLLIDILLALLHLKNSKRYHFDIKPDNLLKFINKFVISDFGTARLIDFNKNGTFSFKGFTSEYASPELLNQQSWSGV